MAVGRPYRIIWFRTWGFDIASLLAGENSIAIRFSSPLPYIEQQQQIKALPVRAARRK